MIRIFGGIAKCVGFMFVAAFFIGSFIPPALNLLGWFCEFGSAEAGPTEMIAWGFPMTIYVFAPLLVMAYSTGSTKNMTIATIMFIYVIIVHTLILASTYDQNHIATLIIGVITAIADIYMFIHIMCEREKNAV